MKSQNLPVGVKGCSQPDWNRDIDPGVADFKTGKNGNIDIVEYFLNDPEYIVKLSARFKGTQGKGP